MFKRCPSDPDFGNDFVVNSYVISLLICRAELRNVALLGQFRALFGCPGHSWGVLGAPLGHLGFSRALLGHSWDDLGVSWGALGSFSERLGTSWGALGASQLQFENIKKPMVFFLIC